MPTSPAVRSRAAADHPVPADDPSAICLLEVPEIGPPFDDDLARAEAPGRDTARVRPARTAPGADTGAAGPAGAPRDPGDPSDPGAGPDGDWARQFARLLTEALSGARPVRQILPWTSERARVQLGALMPLFAGGQRPRLLRVIATRPARDVIEMTVIAGLGARTRALAVRLQRADPVERPGWLNPAGSVRPGRMPALPAQAIRAGSAPTMAAAPRWLCTDIEAA
jgi:Family of unknown function (DUF6459)